MLTKDRANLSFNLPVTEVAPARPDVPHLLCGHGWGQSGAALLPLAESLRPFAGSTLIDFPGFGKSAMPPAAWGTADYADFMAEWVVSFGIKTPLIWLGHSFGCRVGLQLAARHPQLISGMVLIAAAGLKRERSIPQQIRMRSRVLVFKAAKKILPEGPGLDHLRNRFGSADYRNAGEMRPIFVRVVSEDLSGVAEQVRCPTLLLYGSADTETPPEFGERFRSLIPEAELTIFEGFNHLNILSEGRHQVALRIRKFLEGRRTWRS
jgi:pimeloyl-ACP methyl ester carboxylesterase